MYKNSKINIFLLLNCFFLIIILFIGVIKLNNCEKTVYLLSNTLEGYETDVYFYKVRIQKYEYPFFHKFDIGYEVRHKTTGLPGVVLEVKDLREPNELVNSTENNRSYLIRFINPQAVHRLEEEPVEVKEIELWGKEESVPIDNEYHSWGEVPKDFGKPSLLTDN